MMRLVSGPCSQIRSYAIYGVVVKREVPLACDRASFGKTPAQQARRKPAARSGAAGAFNRGGRTSSQAAFAPLAKAGSRRSQRDYRHAGSR